MKPGNSPGKLYAAILADGPGRSGPEAVGGRSDTAPDVPVVGPTTRCVVLEIVGALSTGETEAGTADGGNTGGDYV